MKLDHAGDNQVNLPGACTEVEMSVREAVTRGPPVQRSPSTTSAPGDGTSNATNHPNPNGDSYTGSIAAVHDGILDITQCVV